MCKYYQGSEDKQLEAKLKELFAVVHREKPESSRSVSLPRSTDFYSFPRTDTSRNPRRATS